MNKHKKFIKDAYEGKYGSMCQNWKDTILKHYPEFKEEEFKVGDWVTVKIPKFYYWRDDTVRISRIENGNYWSFNDLSCDKQEYVTNPSEVYRKATPKEVEEHLIAEAKRRGYKNGVVVKSFVHDIPLEIKDYECNYEYIERLDKLHFGISKDKYVVIYEKGQWAEILNTMTKKEAEEKLGCKIVD